MSSTSYTVVSRNKRRIRSALSGFRIFTTRPNGVQADRFPCFPRSRSTTPKKSCLSHTVRKRKNEDMGGRCEKVNQSSNTMSKAFIYNGMLVISIPNFFSIIISIIIMPSISIMGTAPFFVVAFKASFENFEVVINIPCSKSPCIAPLNLSISVRPTVEFFQRLH